MIVVSQHKTPPGFLLPGRRAVHLDAGGLKAWGAFLPPREVLPPADVAHEKLSLPELRGQHGGFLPPPVTAGRSRNPSLDGKRPPAAMRWAVALEGVAGVPTGRGMRRAVPALYRERRGERGGDERSVGAMGTHRVAGDTQPGCTRAPG